MADYAGINSLLTSIYEDLLTQVNNSPSDLYSLLSTPGALQVKWWDEDFDMDEGL